MGKVLFAVNVVLYCFVVTLIGTMEKGGHHHWWKNPIEEHSCSPEDLVVATTWLPPGKLQCSKKLCTIYPHMDTLQPKGWSQGVLLR